MSNDIERLELTVEQANKSIKLMEQLEKLNKNREFKAIIEEELLDNYARNTVYLLSDPSCAGEADQSDLIKDLEMIGRFRMFLSSIYQKGHVATKSIADANEMIDELRAEGVAE